MMTCLLQVEGAQDVVSQQAVDERCWLEPVDGPSSPMMKTDAPDDPVNIEGEAPHLDPVALPEGHHQHVGAAQGAPRPQHQPAPQPLDDPGEDRHQEQLVELGVGHALHDFEERRHEAHGVDGPPHEAERQFLEPPGEEDDVAHPHHPRR